ncbi:MAG: FecCD family ABC transporter permease [Verrucomicrobiota bacterium JB025]|nr:iron ABC transporter permease [Verrucomicrobiota bacterium JB025]
MNRGIVISLLFGLAVVVLVVSPMVGMEFIPLTDLWGGAGSLDAGILRDLRVPRVLTAFVVGSALALSGMAFQAVFRNPLATPFTLGTASGASLGAAIYIRFGLSLSLFGVSGISFAAFAGSLLSVAMVYGLTRVRSGFSTATLLLAGVAVSFFFSSLILFIHYISGFANSFRIMRWMMGSVDLAGYDSLFDMLPFVGAGALVVVFKANELNLLMTGDDIAASRGVNVNRTKKLLFVAASLMVGGVVAFCGPIGFVGMMAPHICRLMVGSEHRTLIPATALFGGAFLVICDTLARTVIAPVEMPVGVITALIGGPFFIVLLLRQKGGLGL